jgi:hypothetical protein
MLSLSLDMRSEGRPQYFFYCVSLVLNLEHLVKKRERIGYYTLTLPVTPEVLFFGLLTCAAGTKAGRNTFFLCVSWILNLEPLLYVVCI